MRNFKNYLLIGLLGTGLIFTSCSDDDAPGEENEVEIITDVTLIFTNNDDATDIVMATATDPDGTGTRSLEVQEAITLSADATYTLTYSILNALDPDDIENIGVDDIGQELDEHQLFYAWTDNLFADPLGNGNILASDTDTGSTIIGDGGTVDYKDTDGTNPVGLVTEWQTAPAATTGGSFRVRLQHQPELKTANSDSNTGDTDFDLTFSISIEL